MENMRASDIEDAESCFEADRVLEMEECCHLRQGWRCAIGADGVADNGEAVGALLGTPFYLRKQVICS